MTELRALWVSALLGCAGVTAQAQAPATPAATAAPTKEAAREAAVAVRPAEPEPPRRLKFKGRAGNCLCADPITDDELEAAAARQNEASTKTQTPRSKP
jgi:hypothetical protein